MSDESNPPLPQPPHDPEHLERLRREALERVRREEAATLPERIAPLPLPEDERRPPAPVYGGPPWRPPVPAPKKLLARLMEMFSKRR
jgi:hypothetical protein